MDKKKTLEERYGNEILTDNTKIPKYEQCKDCSFRKMQMGDSLIDDYRRSSCMIFTYPKMKPTQFYDGSAKCEFYEKEKKQK